MAGMNAKTLDEVADVMGQLPVKYQAIVAIGISTGCRISEILCLRRSDLLDRDGTLKDRIAFVRRKAEKRKKGSERPAPVRHRMLGIPQDLRKYVEAHLRHEQDWGWDMPGDFVFRGQKGKPLSRRRVYEFFRRLFGAGFGTHWMRKTFAQYTYRSYLERHPADPMTALELTRQALGHARIDTTVKYLGIREQDLAEVQDEIFNGKGL